MGDLSAWWRGQGRWEWWAVGALVLAVIALAKSGGGHSHPAARTPFSTSMLAKDRGFWDDLTEQQKGELVADCRSRQAATWAAQSRSIVRGVPTSRLEAEINHLYAEQGSDTEVTIEGACKEAVEKIVQPEEEAAVARKETKEKREEEHKERQEEALKTSVTHHTFTANEQSLRRYISAEHIGEYEHSARNIRCTSEACNVEFNDSNPNPSGIVNKLLGLATGRKSSIEEELIEAPNQIFAAVFADHRMQSATVTSWIDTETVGGKRRRWPALRISCSHTAAAQIDWENVSLEGLQQLCDYKLFPRGTPR